MADYANGYNSGDDSSFAVILRVVLFSETTGFSFRAAAVCCLLSAVNRISIIESPCKLLPQQQYDLQR